MNEQDCSAVLQEQVMDARSLQKAMRIRGNNSKTFLHDAGEGVPLDVASHRGVVDYDPTEMVMTARVGTPIAEINEILLQHGQLLPCESPSLDGQATLGGTVAARVDGPRAPFSGSVSDVVLGCKMLNGKGEKLSFGGRVLKNVAGYDISRLMVGSFGMLGVLLEVSFKVLPRPAREISVAVEAKSLGEALQIANQFILQALPVSAVCYQHDQLYCRFSGTERGMAKLRDAVGGEKVEEEFWSQLGNCQLPFFNNDGAALWRLDVPPNTPEMAMVGDWLIERNGALRWYRGEESVERIREACGRVNGTATLMAGGGGQMQRFHPLAPALLEWHQRLKSAFDPDLIFNKNIMYQSL